MKKLTLMLLALLSATNTPLTLGCIGWANKLVATLCNENGGCSDLPTEEQQKECYKFKQDYLSKWNTIKTALEEVQSDRPDMKIHDDCQMILDSQKFIVNPFKTTKELIAALAVGNNNAAAAEKIVAKMAAYHAENSTDSSFKRMDIRLIGMTEAGKNTPKCR